jgi:large subunit ribosomal protein L22
MTKESLEVSAKIAALKSSPLKIQKIVSNLIGMKVSEAVNQLKFSKLKSSDTISKLIKSATANAENNHNLDIDNLYIKKFDLGRSFVLKRFATRGRGKSSRILKTFSNIKVVLFEKTN